MRLLAQLLRGPRKGCEAARRGTLLELEGDGQDGKHGLMGSGGSAQRTTDHQVAAPEIFGPEQGSESVEPASDTGERRTHPEQASNGRNLEKAGKTRTQRTQERKTDDDGSLGGGTLASRRRCAQTKRSEPDRAAINNTRAHLQTQTNRTQYRKHENSRRPQLVPPLLLDRHPLPPLAPRPRRSIRTIHTSTGRARREHPARHRPRRVPHAERAQARRAPKHIQRREGREDERVEEDAEEEERGREDVERGGEEVREEREEEGEEGGGGVRGEAEDVDDGRGGRRARGGEREGGAGGHWEGRMRTARSVCIPIATEYRVSPSFTRPRHVPICPPPTLTASDRELTRVLAGSAYRAEEHRVAVEVSRTRLVRKTRVHSPCPLSNLARSTRWLSGPRLAPAHVHPIPGTTQRRHRMGRSQSLHTASRTANPSTQVVTHALFLRASSANGARPQHTNLAAIVTYRARDDPETPITGQVPSAPSPASSFPPCRTVRWAKARTKLAYLLDRSRLTLSVTAAHINSDTDMPPSRASAASSRRGGPMVEHNLGYAYSLFASSRLRFFPVMLSLDARDILDIISGPIGRPRKNSANRDPEFFTSKIHGGHFTGD
ncbi:hypothetical protein BKA93DRAFT_753866 [Sparassis latifolia]